MVSGDVQNKYVHIYIYIYIYVCICKNIHSVTIWLKMSWIPFTVLDVPSAQVAQVNRLATVSGASPDRGGNNYITKDNVYTAVLSVGGVIVRKYGYMEDEA